MAKKLRTLSADRRELLDRMLKKQGIHLERADAIPRRTTTGPCELSFAQQRLWFVHQLRPDSPAYNVPDAYRLEGALDVPALQRSLNEIVRRHEVLRTTFPTVAGRPVQEIAPALELPLKRIDLRASPEAQRLQEVERVATEEARRPFDLERGPLLRTTLLQLGSHDHALLVTVHHIVFDGWSRGLFRHELAVLYSAFVANQPSPLEALPLQYADVALWQREQLQHGTLQSQLGYWKQQLQDAPPVLQLLTDRPRPAVQTFHGAKHSIHLSAELTKDLNTLAKQENHTLYVTLLAAFKTFLYRYTGQDDILVGSPIANRNRPDIEHLIGFFANTLVLRTDLSDGPSFRALLRRVSDMTQNASAHQDLPFEKLVEELHPERSLNHHPLFQVMFALQNAPMPSTTLPNLSLSRMRLDSRTAKFDLTLFLWEDGDRLAGAWEYSTDLFDQETAARMSCHFETLLQGIVADPDRSIATLPLLTTDERRQFVAATAQTELDSTPPSCLHRLFEARVEQNPDAVALECGERKLSYRVLNQQANRLSHHLIALGVEPGAVVGVCAEPSWDVVVGILAVLKTGAAFMPLSPSDPKSRLASTLSRVRPTVLLTHERLLPALPEHPTVFCLDRDAPSVARQRQDNPVTSTTPETRACVLPSAGKLVAVDHQAACNRVRAVQDLVGLSPSDKVLHTAHLVQEGAALELLWPLLHGAQLVVADGFRPTLVSELESLIATHHVTTVRIDGAALPAFLEPRSERAGPLPSLQRLLCEAEPAPDPHFQALLQQAPYDVFALYNLSEAGEVTSMTYGRDKGDDLARTTRPTANTVCILDQNLEPVPVGVPGQIHVAGPGLAEGYLDADAETRRRLARHPFSTGAGPRLFDTGDRGRIRTDGSLEVLGPAEREISLDGFRIDLAEVESALRSETSVEDCVVIRRGSGAAGARLIAYVVCDGAFSPDPLQESLRERLPDHMVPGAYVSVSALPLTAAGRVDEAALARLPVLDQDLVGRWEASLSRMPELDQLAVVIDERVERIAPFHVTDVVPETSHLTAPESSATTTVLGTVGAEPRAAVARPLAVSSGGPLQIPSDAPKTLSEAFIRTASRYAERQITYVLADGSETSQTYGAMLQEAKRILGGLRAMGMKPGDRAILQIGSLREYFPTFWGCVLGGVTPVTVAVAPSYDEENAVVNKLFNTWKLLEQPPILASDALVESLRGLSRFLDMEGVDVRPVGTLRDYPPATDIHPSRPDDLVFFQLTSGSTGVPKCIQETNRGIIAHIHGAQQFNGYSPNDVSLNWLPVDHVVPILTCHLKDVYLGCRQVQVATDAVLGNPLAWLDLIERYHATHTWAPNFGFKLVADAVASAPDKTWDLSSMKFFMNAGEQVTLPVVRDFLERVAPFGVASRAMQPAFGMAEACTCMTYQNDFDCSSGVHRIRKSSLAGHLQVADDDEVAIPFVDLGGPVPGVQIRITDKENKPLPEGVIGRMQIKGPVITPGYLNNPTANEEAFVGDGWFNSGDLGFILDGRLTLTGREKELIIIHGANHYCYEIEDIVSSVDGVEPTYVAACGFDDPETGTAGLAIFYSPRFEGIENNLDVIKAIQDKLTSGVGLNPTFVIPVPKREFPKTTSGKIQRTKLKNGLAAGDFRSVQKEIDLYSENANTLPGWFYRKTWRRRQVYPDTGPLSRRCHIVLLDDEGLGAFLCDELERRGARCVKVEPGPKFEELERDRFRIDPARADDYASLMASVVQDGTCIDQVLHLWTYEAPREPVSTADALERAQLLGVHSVLFLTQALAKTCGADRPIRMHIVSANIQPIGVGADIAYAHAPLVGFVKTISQEMPWLSCSHVDLASDRAEVNGPLVLNEISASSSDREVAYRNQQRLIPRLERVNLLRHEKRGLPIERGGIYLMSGGLGGVGVQIAKSLLQRYEARLLLVGRTVLPPRHTWQERLARQDHVAARIEAYRSLLELPGDVEYAAVDICDLGALQQVVDRATARWGGELCGIFHMAGALRECLIGDESHDGMADTLRPKIAGTWTLHELLKTHKGGIFVNFSSVNGFFGGTTAGAYSAANSFLDVFTHYQNQHDSITSFCYSWSMWDEVGMSRGYQMKDLSRSRGYYAISAQQAIDSLWAGLYHDQSHLLIGLDGANPHIRRHTSPGQYAAQQLTAYYTDRGGVISPTPLQQLSIADRFGTPSACAYRRLDEMPLTDAGDIAREALRSGNARLAGNYVTPHNPIEETLAGIWSEILHVDRVGAQDHFFDLGGHSLQITQVMFRVRDEFNVQLAVRTLFEEPTVGGMAQAIQRALDGDAKDGPVLDLTADAVLDEAISPKDLPVVPVTGQPAHIFLTGATGFLGAFLLSELLQQTDADVHCLVRATSAEESKKRLQAALEAYALWDEDHSSRIIPVVGDLSQTSLGLAPEQFQELAARTDVIYHSGALVNFTYPYSALKSANVLGTQEVLRLATQSRVKPVHFISTIGVFLSDRVPQEKVIRDDDIPAHSQGLRLGYSQSKWVAERLVMIARARGVPVSIYRPGRISGDSRTGVCQTEDFFWRIVKACVQSGYVPEMDMKVDLVPVDYVCKAIVHLSKQPEQIGKAFNLLNPQPLAWQDLLTWLAAYGYTLEQLPYEEWRAKLINVNGDADDSAAYRLMPALLERAPGRSNILFECNNARDGLAGTDIACPSIEDEILKTYFSYYIRRGFLDAPQTTA